MIKKNNNSIITKKQCSDVEALCVEISPYITSPSLTTSQLIVFGYESKVHESLDNLH